MSDAAHNGTVSLVVFGIEDHGYALRVYEVQRVLPMVQISPLPKAPAIALGVINFHGSILPVLDLRRRLGLPARDYGPSAHLLVARTVRRTLALPVDEVMGVREVAATAVAPANTILPGIGHVEGIVALPDSVLFIHDLETFLSLDEEQQLSEALAEMTT